MTDQATTDPVLVEVVRNRLQAVAEEMGVALARTAHSVNIRDRHDFSCGVYRPDGRLAAQAEHIPVHLGLLCEVVPRILGAWGAPLRPGDMLVTNDPYITGSHMPDVVVFAPVHDGSELLGYVANMAHQVDVGGQAPGSLSMASTEIFHEGLRLPPLLLCREEEVDRGIVRLVQANSRTPDEVAGDLLAQVAANMTGIRRVLELAHKIGRDTLDHCTAQLLAATTRRLAGRIAEMPERRVEFADVLEWDRGGTPGELRVQVAVARRGDRLAFDFAGTSPQVAGPINTARPLTLSCLLYALKAVLDPEIPSNAGMVDCLEFATPPGSLVDARFPAAVALCTSITSQRIVDVILGALNQLVPERAMAASTGSMNALIIGGVDPRTGKGYSYVETYGGGQGALRTMDGADGVHTHMTNTSNSPVEMIERAYPLRVLRYALVPDSEGAGRFRGGVGMTRELLVRGDATVTIHLDRTRHQPWGIDGGQPASVSRCTVTAGDEMRTIPGKSTFTVADGAVIRLVTAGGGGAGNPSARSPEAIARDVRDGLVTSERARSAYGYRGPVGSG
jgi:N-methylhydantoinase B